MPNKEPLSASWPDEAGAGKNKDSSRVQKNSKRNRILFYSVAIMAVIGIAYLCYYLLYGRFYQYTDDAYVNGNMIFLTPQIPGVVTTITADNTDYVVMGRVLVELDRTDAQIALEKASAELGETVREVVSLFERVEELEAEISKNKAIFVRRAQDFEHRQALIDEGAVSTEELEHAAAYLQESFADLILTEHQYISAIAQVENTTVKTHPKVEKAKEMLKEAYVNLQRCTILSPVTGLVAQRNVQVGKQVRVGEPMLAIIPLDQMWIDANFKEVQLSKMRIGQPASVYSDLWGSGLLFHGTVVGIGGGTGSVFSVLPPQNATGNWIKIVQRIPVRIALNPEEIQKHPLRLGISMEVTVDLHNTELREIPLERKPIPLYQTDVLSHQEKGADVLIEKIIAINLSPTFLETMNQEKP